MQANIANNIIYQKGDIVLTKIRGYPWWPGIVLNI